MIDTKDPYTWNTRRVNYACPVERTDRREPMTLGLRVLRAAIFIASALLVCVAVGYSYEVLSDYWPSIAQLLGSKR